ncbi:MAG: extracellular catalytic domain type 2 short-chain-length polyhydroxyalkanoate depolymerase [Actinocrinis sp.]
MFGPATATARAATGLTPYDIGADYVSGVSSGGNMANQLAVAHSATFKGAAVFAASQYDCALDNAYQAIYGCAENLYPAYLSTDEANASAWAADGLIDSTSNLSAQRDWFYHGTRDTVVAGALNQDDVSFFQHFGASAQYADTTPSGHGWISPLGPGACTASAAPYIDNCGIDVENSFLTKLLGSVNPPNTGQSTGTLRAFSQSQYAPGGSAAAISMASTGYAYVPTSCAAGAACTLMVALHGCEMSATTIGLTFVHDSYLDNYADTNNMVVLYPQAQATAFINPLGCWDWWGYLGAGDGAYPTRNGLQITAIMNMVHALGG